MSTFKSIVALGLAAAAIVSAPSAAFAQASKIVGTYNIRMSSTCSWAPPDANGNSPFVVQISPATGLPRVSTTMPVKLSMSVVNETMVINPSGTMTVINGRSSLLSEAAAGGVTERRRNRSRYANFRIDKASDNLVVTSSLLQGVDWSGWTMVDTSVSGEARYRTDDAGKTFYPVVSDSPVIYRQVFTSPDQLSSSVDYYTCIGQEFKATQVSTRY